MADGVLHARVQQNYLRDVPQMLTLRYLLCVTLLALVCIQYSEAWPWSWSRGGHTITGDVRGIPGVTRSWIARIRWGWRFARRGDTQQSCSQLAKAVVTREQWGAVAARQELAINGRAEELFVWHTGPNTCNAAGLSAVECQSCLREQSCTEKVVKALQDADFKGGKDDIKYNFLIGQDGVIYEGRGWDVIGQHTIGKNSKSIGVALIGDFSKIEPSQASQDALNSLIVCGKESDKLATGAQMTTGAQMAGKAFYNLLVRCNGLCVEN
ncbi:hypothetical protein LSH36_103g06087 [Paralvinella palmiformis]|uniref:Peptidoglycan recognition protein family domain-containing protein n=1 Tax=Paralvinella palmiformis TaxID=53620 RepID=A0AAD9JZJ0_9ANNE|nr:hypothetical protein LSH36_103g06087 [Paralvinella palmiformis]